MKYWRNHVCAPEPPCTPESPFYENLRQPQNKREEYIKKGFLEMVNENVKLKSMFYERMVMLMVIFKKEHYNVVLNM